MAAKNRRAESESETFERAHPRSEPFTEESKAVFYSHWYYSGIRLQTSIPGFESVEGIAEYFQLPKAVVRRVLEFLVSHGLCRQVGGKTLVGPARTYIPPDSPHAARHHTNWRLKAIERYPTLSATELAYTSPMSLSQKDAGQIRKLIEELIDNVGEKVLPSQAEHVYCLNVDWFQVGSGK